MIRKSSRLLIAGAVAAASLTGAGVSAAVAATSANGCTVTATPVLAQGKQGAQVKTLQCLLNKHAGRKVLAEDGAFGPQTNAEVRSFQARKGLAVDGYVGPKTWAALKAPVGSKPTTRPTTQPTAPSTKREAILRTARAQLGKPYAWGAEGPGSFDCSGLTQYVYKQNGIKVRGRTANDQGHGGTRISLSQLQPGDLVVFANGDNAYHIGIYIGDGKMIHAPKPGDHVKITEIKWLSGNKWGVRYL